MFVIRGFWREEPGEAPGDRPGVVGDSVEDTEVERLRDDVVMGIGRDGGEVMAGGEKRFRRILFFTK